MTLTRHAKERMQQRRIAADQVEMALHYGERFQGDGVLIYALSRDCGCYPTALPWCLRGLVVIVDEAMRVITTYRCPKRNLRKRFGA